MIGITAVNMLIAVIALFVTDRQRALTAVAIGWAAALIYVIHMAVTVDDALCLDEKGATVQTRKQMAIRYAFVCAVFIISVYYKIADPIFLVISLITIKAGAYLQPYIHRYSGRRKDK